MISLSSPVLQIVTHSVTGNSGDSVCSQLSFKIINSSGKAGKFNIIVGPCLQSHARGGTRMGRGK